jgi:hypothetical protein
MTENGPTIDQIEKEIKQLHYGFNQFIKKCETFEILNEKLVPEGLPPHTRSIAWLAEHVIIQGLRKYKEITKFEDVIASSSDIKLNDCTVKISNNTPDLLVNVKISNVDAPRNQNDINKAFKIFKAFSEDPNCRLYYVIIKFRFDNTKVTFIENPIVLYTPWINKIYVNKSNHHLQDYYDNPPTIRTVKKFLNELDTEIDRQGVPRR